jgi:beta-N-acetylhexosaminidase
VPALEQELPATLSSAVVDGLLRGELGFRGVVVSDALEMASVARAYGVGGAAVRALRAGCDALCLGGEADGEPVLAEAVASIVAAVETGELAVGRLRDAGARVRGLRAARTRAVDPGAASLTDADMADIAARAVRSAGDTMLGPGPALLVELDPVPTIAVGRTPWGLADALTRVRPGSRVVRPGRDDDPAQAFRCAQGVDPRAVVVVTRDEPRHPWQSALVQRLTTELTGLVHVEMGVPGVPSAVARGRLWTHGASRASARAAVQALTAGGP